LKLEYHKLLSSLALNSNLRRYNEVLPELYARLAELPRARGMVSIRVSVAADGAVEGVRWLCDSLVPAPGGGGSPTEVGPGTYCSPCHFTRFFNPRFLSSMASYHVASNMCVALDGGARRHHAGDRRDADGLPVPARARPHPDHAPVRIRLALVAVGRWWCHVMLAVCAPWGSMNISLE